MEQNLTPQKIGLLGKFYHCVLVHIISSPSQKIMYRKEVLAEVVSLSKDAGMVKSPTDNPSCCDANGNNKSTPLTANKADGCRWRL